MKRYETTVSLIHTTIRYVVFAIAFGVVLFELIGPTRSAALAGASLLVLLIGFSAQRFLTDIIAGVFMFIEGWFSVGDTITIEPFRVKCFPVVKDLVVDRSALDRIVQAGGFISARAGSAPEANSILVPKTNADLAMEAAACIGCGACAAACPNASAMLFTAAKVSHLALLPQGDPERASRALKMVSAMDAEGFGNCTNTYECEAVCPAEISASFIAKLNREYARASLRAGAGE